MDALRLLKNEVRLLSRSNLARAFLLVTAVLGAVGINAIEYSNQMNLHEMPKSSATTSLGSAQYGAMGGAALFGMLTLLTLSRDRRKRSLDLLEASRPYAAVITARIGALLVWACLTTVATGLAGWLGHLVLVDAPYELPLYLFGYTMVLLPGIVYSILICSSLYLACENLDIAFLSFGVMYMLGFKSANYLLLWVQTSASVYSHFGGAAPVQRFIVYNRLFCTCSALAIMFAGLLLRRRSGLGVAGSTVRNVKGGVVPILLGTVVVLAVVVHIREPYLFPEDAVAQQKLPITERVRLEEVESQVTLHTREHSLTAEVCYTFEKDPAEVEVEFDTNAGLKIESAQLDGSPVAWQYVPNTDRIILSLPHGDRVEVAFRYSGTIKVPSPNALPGYICDKSVYLLENSHWIFQPLTACAKNVRASGSVLAPDHLTVVTPGQLEAVTEAGPMRRWDYRATTSTLNLGLFAADYQKQEFEAGDLNVELYVSTRHVRTAAGLEYKEHIRKILEHYQQKLGPHRFKNEPIKVVETSLYKPGGHSSLNVVTLAEYLFNKKPITTPTDEIQFVIHDLKLLAHELAHQWWATGVEVPLEGAWSSEGLAEYTAYRYLADAYPGGLPGSIQQRWDSAVQRTRGSYFAKHPEVLKTMRPEFVRGVTSGKLAADLYSAMPLMLLKAEEHLGVDVFVPRIAAAYKKHLGGSLSFSEFLTETGLTEEVMSLD